MASDRRVRGAEPGAVEESELDIAIKVAETLVEQAKMFEMQATALYGSLQRLKDGKGFYNQFPGRGRPHHRGGTLG